MTLKKYTQVKPSGASNGRQFALQSEAQIPTASQI